MAKLYPNDLLKVVTKVHIGFIAYMSKFSHSMGEFTRAAHTSDFTFSKLHVIIEFAFLYFMRPSNITERLVLGVDI